MNYKKLRKYCFQQYNRINPELLEVIDSVDSPFNFANPATINVYAFLANYSVELTKQYFKKSIGDINMLDWGCGRGHNTYLLRELGGNPVSCDLNVDAVDSAFGQETPIIDRYNIDVIPLNHPYKLPFESNSFDVVLSYGVLEHVSHDFESLKEINRILKDGGLLLCYFLPYFLSWTQPVSRLTRLYTHDRLYSKSQVYKLLKESQFDLIDIWHRQILPKNVINYPNYTLFERLDQFLTDYTPLHYFVTNIEFVAAKRHGAL